jgi:hypothetical protein
MAKNIDFNMLPKIYTGPTHNVFKGERMEGLSLVLPPGYISVFSLFYFSLLENYNSISHIGYWVTSYVSIRPSP